MHQERCKADEAKGRVSEIWTIGTRLAADDVEGNERALEDGLKYAKRDAAAYEVRCLLEPEKEKERKAAAAKSAAHAEAQKLIAAAAVHKRIERGDLVEAKFYQAAPDSWAAVDEKTQAWHFWETSVACESWGGKLWVDKKQVLEAGLWALQSGPGVAGGEAGGGLQCKTAAPSPAQTDAAVETRPEKKAKLQK